MNVAQARKYLATKPAAADAQTILTTQAHTCDAFTAIQVYVRDAAALEKLSQLHRDGDAQGAAEFLASLQGIEQQNAMDEATRVGFVVEFYANSIRVSLTASHEAQKQPVAPQIRMTIRKDTITKSEKRALDAIVSSEYQDGGDPVGHYVWTQYCNPFSSKRTFSGVVASLSKKGLVKIGDDYKMDSGFGTMGTIAITTAGVAALKAAA